MDQDQCEHGNTWLCPMYLAHARSTKKHGGKHLSDHMQQCLACHKNPEISMDMKKKKRPPVWSKNACQICMRTRSCTKLNGLIMCSACGSVVSLTKNTPEVIRKIWEQFGPADIPFPEQHPMLPAGYVIKPTSPTEIPVNLNESPFSVLLGRMAAIHNAKKHDYASNDDPLGNFKEARRLGISPLQGIMIRLTDKYTRACNWVRRNGDHAVKDEGLADTLIDLANYSLLALLAYNEAGEEQQLHKVLEKEDRQLKEEDHNAKDVSLDQRSFHAASDLSELQEKVPARGEEEEEQLEAEK